MSAREQFLHRIQAATADTPYVATPTDDGFELTLQLADARWHELLSTSGVTYRHAFKVTVEDDAFRILQTRQRVEWRAGVPRAEGSVAGAVGRFYEFGAERTWVFRPDGTVRRVVDYSFTSHEGLELIRGIGKQLGLREKQPWQVIGAVAMAGLAVGGLVIGGLVVLVLWLAGVI